MNSIYFGHPVNTYGTELESQLIARIMETFPGYAIENPNKPEHQEGYERFKRDQQDGMAYFTEIVLPKCGAGIFLPFRDGAWGAGVHKEALWFAERKLPTWFIDASGGVRKYRPTSRKIHVLTPEETRARIRNATGGPIRY